MVDGALPGVRWRWPSADMALKASAKLWFLVAVAGQWAFVYYILGFYAGPTLHGHFEAWGRNTNLIKGYVAGDSVGNLYFAIHVMVAALITTSGTLQLSPTIRRRAPGFHRWNGRAFILAAFVMAAGGLWMIWIRGTYLTVIGAAGSSLLATMIVVSATSALRLAIARRIDAHERWAMRTFLLANGVWFQRLGYSAWIIANQRPLWITDHMDGPFDLVWGFASFLAPLTMLEIYLRIRGRRGQVAKNVMAAALLGLAGVTGVGIVGAYLFMWSPVLAKA